ncbi:VCBS domain-containing protein [Bradyrhizobium guangxiense]|uniref:VCBS domain-containing protein n=1 Tax=Bradyrhizobium guangxiense TaxID=1325115 RepID=UPI0010092938|nr:VCBS domain-containing protein [Bradyrhizobium guangxiense]
MTANGTLAVSDVDSGENHFQTPASLSGSYGTFTFDPLTGVWTYTLNNAAANVQALVGGQIVHDKLTVTSADGTASQLIDVTITGTNEGASISGTAAGAVKEDGTLAASGTLAVSDVDSGENHFQTPASLSGSYGTFTFDPLTGVWTYTLNNAAANVQALVGGQIVHDKLTVTSADGTASQLIDVTITGTNDGASISGTAAGAVKEDGTLAASGTLAVSDVDSGENHFQTPASLSGSYGTFTFDPLTGVWTYTLNNAAANVQALVGGQIVHDKLTVTSADGTASQLIDVTITGTNDGASISGTAAGAVKEDGTLTANGTLAVSDVDSGENHFQTPASLSGSYGTFTFDPLTGVWTYTLNNAAANVQALVGGQIVHDKLTVTSADGTASQLIDVTITGTNDGASISGTAAGAVKEDGTLTANGTLAVSDVDSGENHFQTPASLSGSYGTFTFDPLTGVWTYTLNNAAANVQALVGGQIVHDKLTVTSADGTASQLIDVTITGTNDNNSAPVVASSATTFDTVKNLAANNGQVVCSDGQFFFGDTNLPVSDADNNHVGIMITAVDNANGDWEYKLAGTTVWLKIPTTGDLLLSANDSVRFIGAANAPIEQLTFKAWDGTDGHVAGDILFPPPTAFGGSTAYSLGTYVVGAKNNAPAGIAGDPINLGLVDPSSDMTYKATVIIKNIPNDWVVNEGERNADGSWTVQTTALDSISVTTPSSFSGALLLDVTASLVFADGTTATVHLGDNVEAYTPSSPIFAWAGNDYLTASNGNDLIVFAQPIGHDILYSFDVSHDQIDLIGYAGFTSFSDVESHLTDDGKGDAVLTLSDGQSILLQGTPADTLTDANFVFDQMPVVNSNGTLTIYDGALLPLTGYVHNSGTIMLRAIGAETDLQLTEYGATLDGGGSIVLSDSDLNIISGTSSNVTLDNKDNTISGAGQLGNGELSLTNAGTIAATGTHQLVIDTGSNLVQNSGVLEASGSGGLTIISSVENSGLLWAHGAKLTVQGTIAGNGSAVVDGGGILDLEASSTANVSFGSETGGTLALGDVFHFNGVISGFKASDVIELENINPNGSTISYLENSEGTGGLLTIANGSQVAHLSFSGDYSADNFAIVSDQVNATSIIYIPRADLM